MRHVIIGSLPPVKPAPASTPTPTPVLSVPADRVRTFLDQVRHVRQLQAKYRRTMDPMLRREMGRVEDLLDASIVTLAEELDAATTVIVVASDPPEPVRAVNEQEVRAIAADPTNYGPKVLVAGCAAAPTEEAAEPDEFEGLKGRLRDAVAAAERGVAQ